MRTLIISVIVGLLLYFHLHNNSSLRQPLKGKLEAIFDIDGDGIM